MRLCVCVCVYVCASAYRCVYVWRQVTSIRQYNWVQYRTYLRHHIDMRNMTMRKCKLFSDFFFIVRVGVCCFLMLFLPQLWNKFKCQIAVCVCLILSQTISILIMRYYINDSLWYRLYQWLTMTQTWSVTYFKWINPKLSWHRFAFSLRMTRRVPLSDKVCAAVVCRLLSKPEYLYINQFISVCTISYYTTKERMSSMNVTNPVQRILSKCVVYTSGRWLLTPLIPVEFLLLKKR